MEPRPDSELIQIAIGPRRINAVREKNKSKLMFWIGPSEGARETGMTETHGTCFRGRIGLCHIQGIIPHKGFVKTKAPAVVVFGELNGDKRPNRSFFKQALPVEFP